MTQSNHNKEYKLFKYGVILIYRKIQVNGRLSFLSLYIYNGIQSQGLLCPPLLIHPCLRRRPIAVSMAYIPTDSTFIVFHFLTVSCTHFRGSDTLRHLVSLQQIQSTARVQLGIVIIPNMNVFSIYKRFELILYNFRTPTVLVVVVSILQRSAPQSHKTIHNPSHNAITPLGHLMVEREQLPKGSVAKFAITLHKKYRICLLVHLSFTLLRWFRRTRRRWSGDDYMGVSIAFGFGSLQVAYILVSILYG